ncbi:STAS domain-containing protein [Bacillus sp. FJAT-45037]|uniref:STAS domain-containing protein n=1 Tax=Bacillus sp. FJAT-45037 TaxID=2011007 RepID=UPI000C24BAE3|nr:STAS domain-containing protein [Bacillus sp. FJAT-45037]
MTRYEINREDDRIKIKIVGDLDIESTELFEEELLPIMVAERSVVLNLKEVPFIDSSGIGILINSIQTLNELKIHFLISEVRKEVMDILELLQVPDIVGREIFANG